MSSASNPAPAITTTTAKNTAPAITTTKNPNSPPDKSLIQFFTDLLKKLYTIFEGNLVVQNMSEIGHLAPVILSLGSLFMALITLNYPLAIFGLSAIEANYIYTLFHMFGNFMAVPSLDMMDSKSDAKCKSSFQTLTSSRFKMFMSQGLQNEFPNSALYFISFAASYCIQSMYFFSDECTSLGPQYSNRPYLAIIGAAMFIILYSLYLLSYGCDSIISMGISIIIGFLVGYFICYQNYLLLGKLGVDLLFIPSLAIRTNDYVCVATAQ